MKNWIDEFNERFLEIVTWLPSISTLSFSGGVESSAILFAMLKTHTDGPYECVTFTVGGEENKDSYYARKICDYYRVPLEVVDIPIKSREELIEEVREIIEIIGIARNIDIQVCHAYKYIFPRVDTVHIITGFYEDIHYEANKVLSMMYNNVKKGRIDPLFFRNYYRQGRMAIYNGTTRAGTIHNYKTIEKYFKHEGKKLHCPFKDRQLFDITQERTYEETNFYKGRFKKKWFITQEMFQDEFKIHGNAKNSNNMHTQGMKQYHRNVLLEGTQYKDTIAVYNRIKKSIGEYGKKSSALTLL